MREMRRIVMIGNAMLFLFGFTSIVSVYEVAKTDKKVKVDTINRKLEKVRKYFR